MSTTSHAVENSTGNRERNRSIEPGRFDRALADPMTVERTADRFYTVTTENGGYDVDLRTGACSCPDAEYRGDRFVCKHAIRSALVEIIAHTVSTELVARVARYTREQGCPVGGHGGRCPGPLGGSNQLPCPTCMDAVRTDGVDEFTVWSKVVAPYRSQR